MRRTVFSLVILMLVAIGSNGQQANVRRYTAPLAGQVVLRDVDDKYSGQVYSLEMPEPDADAETEKLRAAKAEVAARFPRKSNMTDVQKRITATVQPPTIAISFVADSLSGIPPDNYSAVGKDNKAVTVMNSYISVHDATTGAFAVRKTLAAFAAGLGLNGTNNFKYDPKVIYDPAADRYITVILNGTKQYNNVVLGFSQTNDPGGRWNLYKLYGDYMADTTWFDYPAISITQNEIFLTGNKIKYDSSWQAGFTQTLIYQINKKSGYDSSTLGYQIWTDIKYDGRNLRCLYPVKPADSILGPGQYFLSNRNFDASNDSVFLIHVPDTIGSTSATITVTALAGPTSYGAPPDARQPDTSSILATNDGRVLGGFLKGNEIQFVSTSVNPANGNAAVFHGTISNVNTAPTFAGHIYSIDSLDFGYPNISFTGNINNLNQSIISFEYSGPHTPPGYGAILSDGTDYSDMVTIRSGESSIKILSQKEQRWGDYTASQPDWNGIGSVWVHGIYGRYNHNYGNYMAKLNSPYRVGFADPQPTVSESQVYPNPAVEFVRFEFNVANEQVFSFRIFDMQGKMVAKVMDEYCYDGKNVVQFNIASLAKGSYLLKAIGEKGETIKVHTFVKQ